MFLKAKIASSADSLHIHAKNNHYKALKLTWFLILRLCKIIEEDLAYMYFFLSKIFVKALQTMKTNMYKIPFMSLKIFPVKPPL